MSDRARDEVTKILTRIQGGSGSTADLMPWVYEELRALADRMMSSERGDHTLDPTALVHEVFVRLAEGSPSLGAGRAEFLAVAAQAMRNLLVDHSRRHRAEKRGAAWGRVTLSGLAPGESAREVDVVDLHDALEELAQVDARQARIVEMCFFAGMSGREVGDVLGVHRNTIVRELRMARAWLRLAMDRRGA